tara:strand:- start:203 stop:409 length:207 start_codon:yes stop_codon:yes gene_type:complete
MKKKYVVKRKCVAQDFVFVDADHAEEALARVKQGEGKPQSMLLEFVEGLPMTEWEVEELSKARGGAWE